MVGALGGRTWSSPHRGLPCKRPGAISGVVLRAWSSLNPQNSSDSAVCPWSHSRGGLSDLEVCGLCDIVITSDAGTNSLFQTSQCTQLTHSSPSSKTPSAAMSRPAHRPAALLLLCLALCQNALAYSGDATAYGRSGGRGSGVSGEQCSRRERHGATLAARRPVGTAAEAWSSPRGGRLQCRPHA